MIVRVATVPGRELRRAGVAALMDGRYTVEREFTVEGHMPIQMPRRDERRQLILAPCENRNA